MFFEIMSGVLSGIAVAAIIGVTRHFNKVVKDFQERNAKFHEEFNELKESQRNQIKAQIVRDFNKAKKRGYITHMELETCHRLADSYFNLGGNNYIHNVMEQLSDIPVKGDLIPMNYGGDHQ